CKSFSGREHERKASHNSGVVLCWIAVADLRGADSGQWNRGVAESSADRTCKLARAGLVGQSDGCAGRCIHQCIPATEEFVSTFGVIIGNRGFFPDVLARDGREEILRVLDEQSDNALCLTPEESKFGSVETFADARRCADLFRSHSDAIDGVLVSLPNFGDERAIADTLRLARLHAPVLVQATPDAPGKMTIAHRRDSFCGKMSACNNLKQYGIPYSLTSLHTVSPSSAEFKRDLEWFSGVCRVVKGLRNLRVGAIGARPAAFNTVRYSEKILEANAITVETLDLSEVIGRIGRMKDTDDRAVQKLKNRERYVATTGIPQPALLKMAKLGVVIDDWMHSAQVKISAVQCWTSLEENLGVVPCTVMSMMSDSLISSACEVDVCGVIGMHALQL